MLYLVVALSLFLNPILSAMTPKCDESYDFEIQEMARNAEAQAAEVLKDPEFQKFISNAKSTALDQITGETESQLASERGELYVFVSFSIGEKGLISLAEQAKRYNATLVMRGFKDGSYKKTVEALHTLIEKTGQGVIVDPELFEEFKVEAVPTFILTQRSRSHEDGRSTPLHDRMSGQVTLQYALEQFAKDGQVKALAKSYLKTGGPK